jgi:hypothetical protein
MVDARYETDDLEFRTRTHYVVSPLTAVCGARTTGEGVYADEHFVPNNLCCACLTFLATRD